MYRYTAYPFKDNSMCDLGDIPFAWREHQVRNLFIKSELLLRHKLATSDGPTEDGTLSGCDLPKVLQVLSF